MLTPFWVFLIGLDWFGLDWIKAWKLSAEEFMQGRRRHPRMSKGGALNLLPQEGFGNATDPAPCRMGQQNMSDRYLSVWLRGNHLHVCI